MIGRSIADAVSQNLAGPLLRHSGLTRTIPTVPLRKVLFNRHLRSGNIPALFADIAGKYGPAFQIRPPFVKPLVFLAGPATNYWAHRQGRMYLRAKDYFYDFEQAYGASGVLPALDGGTISGFGSPCSRRIPARDLKASLRKYMRMPVPLWLIGRLETPFPQQLHPGE